MPPPGEGLFTVTWLLPAVEMSAMLMAALSCVVLINVVGRLLPFHSATELWTKPDPVRVKDRELSPAAVAVADTRRGIPKSASVGGKKVAVWSPFFGRPSPCFASSPLARISSVTTPSRRGGDSRHVESRADSVCHGQFPRLQTLH